MREHQDGGKHHRSGIGDAFAGDVGRGAVDGFENGVRVAHVGAGDDAESADQTRREVRDNIAIQIRQQKNVEGLGTHHQLHGSVVDDQLVVLDVGKARGDFAAAGEE